MSDASPFQHSTSFEPGEVSGAVRLGRFEAQYEELFAEVIEDGVITVEERARLERAADALGLDRDRLRQLERALEAAYESRHRIRIREVPIDEPTSRASLSPIEPSNDPRVLVYEKKIASLKARIAELEAELEEARAHVAIEVDLAGVGAAATRTEELDDPEELLRHLRHDPRDPDIHRALFRVFGRLGDADRRFSAAHALVFLGAASDEARTYYAKHRADGLIRPRAALEREAFRRFLFHPEEEPLLGEIFAAVIGPVLLGRLTAMRRDKSLPRLDPARKQDPAASTLQAVRCFSWAAAILGMPVPPIYADPEFLGTVEIVPGVAPSARFGQKALSGRSSAELAFLAGRNLSYFREDHFVRALFASIPDLEDIFLAALSIGNPGLPLAGPVKARVGPIARAIEPILEPTQVDRLRGYFLRFVEEGGRTNLQRWANAVDCTAARAGLLLADDLSASKAMLTLIEPTAVDERMNDLLVFVTSDRYVKLRRQLGIAIEEGTPMSEPIGLLAFWKNYDRKLYVRAVKLADELGYDSFWIPEAWGYDVFSLLTEMALSTKRIKLGTAIVNAFSRSPGTLAMSAATVDEISEGRFILGIGPSGKNVIEGFHGRPFEKPLTQVRDVIRVVRTLLAGGKLSDARAELVEYRPFRLAMKPLRPTIPIYVAALKQKAIESVGELADGWIPTFWPYERLAEGRAFLATGAARAGRDPSQIVTAPFTTVLPVGLEAGAMMAKNIISFYIGGMGEYYIELLSKFGFADDCKRIADLYQTKETRGQAAAAVPDAMVEAITISGDPARCVEELRRRRSFGIDLPILNLPNDMPWEMVEMFMRGMAPRG